MSPIPASLAHRVQSKSQIDDILFLWPLLLDLIGQQHEVKERCEGELVMTYEKKTAELRESFK